MDSERFPCEMDDADRQLFGRSPRAPVRRVRPPASWTPASLQTDNQRLVALLAKVPEYKAMAEEIAAESGLHYIPVEECLMIRGQVEQLYPQLLDRPVEQAAGQELAAAGRRRDPDCLDPSLTLVLDEQYHWVPRNALETGMELMRRMLPALPMSQLLVLVAELNKVWRDRERKRLAEVAVAHREELQQLQHTFQQRAPYEAVLAGQKINDLKRRMRAQAAQAAAAAAAAKAEQRRVEDDSKVMLHAGLSSIQDLSRQVARLVSRNKKLASKAARKRALTSQPLCSACLDRLLLSDTLGQPRTGAVGMQHPSHHRQQQQQQEEMDGSTVAAQPHELDFDTGATATTTATTENPGPERLYGNGAACNVPSPHSPRFADGSNRHGSRTARDTFPGSSERRLGPDIPTFNLTARNASGAAAGTGAYTTGVVVSVNTVPPLAQPPRPALGLSCPSGSRTHGSVASPRLLTSTSAISTAAERGQCDSDLGIIPSESPATVPGNYLGPVHADRLDGRNFVTSNTSGSSAAATEASAASLADWRTAASAPITVHLEVRGPNQQNLMMRSGAAQGSDRGNLATTSATSQARVQPRGVPLRVSVRFPRQDIAGSQ
ncbi:hypothetical protein Vretimale_7878 [Volvox reticuliferus]|uniref:Uncharacterized protein n=1 Tax=Volvox reticuliferus TaxID=1737510 RepID=A0A8J4GAE8_9CHLO|nr:hypothetical protein Vretimale_7878 [Volvox reticuliferus]